MPLKTLKSRPLVLGGDWSICGNDMAAACGGHCRKELLDLLAVCGELMSSPSSLSTEKLVVLGEELLAGTDEDGDNNPRYGYMGKPEYRKEPDVEIGLVEPR